MADHDHLPAAPAAPHRRSFFELLTAGLGVAATLAFAVPFVGYLLGPLLKKKTAPPVRLGAVSDFPVGQTRFVTFDNPIRLPWDGMTAHTGVFVCNLGKDQFRVLAVNCAHLGCPVSWFPQSGLFMCPCHGGVYYENGEHASGPPPRGLFRVPCEVKGGQLIIQAPHMPTLQDTLADDA